MSAARSWPACTGSTAAGRTTSTISTGSCAVSEPRGAASPWNPQIAITIDLYSEDWPQLRGVMVQGTAKIIERGPRFKQARARLYATYPQYSIGAALSPADSAIVEVTPTHVFTWGLDYAGIVRGRRIISIGMEMMMTTKRILVPLDGRESAEAIVPIVAALTRDAGATVRLVRIFPVPSEVMTPQGRMVASVDQEMARLESRALADFAPAEMQLAGLPVETVVRYGDPVEEIALEAQTFGADLIALTGGRRGRLRAALAPGIADRLTTRTDTPTLVLHAGASPAA